MAKHTTWTNRVRNRLHFETNDCYLWPLDSVYVCIFKFQPLWHPNTSKSFQFEKAKVAKIKTLTSFWMSSNRKWPLFKSTNGNAETSSLKNTAANQEQLIVPKVMFFPLWNQSAAAMCRNLTNVIYIIKNVPVKTCQCTWHYPELQHFFWFYQRLTGTWRHKDPRPNVPPRRQCCAAWLRHSLPYWTDDRLLARHVADVHLQEQHAVEIHWIWIQIYAAGSNYN